jgi:hypothetical protein
MKRAIFIASAFDKDKPLSQVFLEGHSILSMLTPLDDWKGAYYPLADINKLSEALRDAGQVCYQIFHFAGHAVDKTLQMHVPRIEDMEAMKHFYTDVQGLAEMLRVPQSFQLVFLNGCSTQSHVQAFKNAGIPAVIYTRYALNDTLGAAFARHFYETFFTKGHTLEFAFNTAKAYIQTLAAGMANTIDQALEAQISRCIDGYQAPQPGADLYALEADADFRKKRWQDWPLPVPPQPQVAPDPRAAADPMHKESKEIPEAAAHRCDRRRQVLEFHGSLARLAAKQAEGPVFFFVHDHQSARPDSLVRRFETFGVTELCRTDTSIDQNTFVWKNLPIPEGYLLADPDQCKKRLCEKYRDVFECRFDEAADDYTFVASRYGDKVFIVNHDLTEAGVESAEEIRHLLEYYLDGFSQKIRTELGARLAVVFSYEYFMPDADFENLFAALAADPRFAGRVKNLTGFEPINLRHVGQWHSVVFDGRLHPPPPKPEALFPYAANEEKPMHEVLTHLAAQLHEYNRVIKTVYG